MALCHPFFFNAPEAIYADAYASAALRSLVQAAWAVPYSAFRLMNPDASYLRQDPMGYHEKAFSLFLPFSLDEDEITITEDWYLPPGRSA